MIYETNLQVFGKGSFKVCHREDSRFFFLEVSGIKTRKNPSPGHVLHHKATSLTFSIKDDEYIGPGSDHAVRGSPLLTLPGAPAPEARWPRDQDRNKHEWKKKLV